MTKSAESQCGTKGEYYLSQEQAQELGLSAWLQIFKGQIPSSVSISVFTFLINENIGQITLGCGVRAGKGDALLEHIREISNALAIIDIVKSETFNGLDRFFLTISVEGLDDFKNHSMADVMTALGDNRPVGAISRETAGAAKGVVH